MEFSQALEIVKKEKKQIASGSSYISIWSKWYKGKVPSFHRYYVYNGQKKVYRERLSMKMAKQVCEDWASLLMNEKVKIVVHNQKEMDKLLMDLDFWNKANEAVEKGFALSMCALVINVNGIKVVENEKDKEILETIIDPGKTYLDLSTYTASHLVPITWENGKCVECGFVNEDTNKTTTVVHLRDEDTKQYKIFKKVEYRNNSDKKDELTVLATGSTNPWFVIIHPRVTNNLEVDSPYPISIFANSIDTLKAIDVKYDSYNVEFMQGKKRTYVSAKLDEVDKETGEVKNSFDPDDTVIYQLPAGTTVNGEEKALVVNVTDALRAAEHSQAIQDELNFLAKQTGLGVDYYRFEKGRVMTATQVISEKSDTFRNMKKHEGILEKAIITFIKSIMYAANECTNIHFDNEDEVEVQFDDSIIEDKTTEKDNDRKDVESGIQSKLEFRKKWYGEDEATAKKALKAAFGDTDLASRIATFGQALSTNGITYKEYVDQVYPDKSDEEKKQIIEDLKAMGNITADSLGFYTPPGDNK